MTKKTVNKSIKNIYDGLPSLKNIHLTKTSLLKIGCIVFLSICVLLALPRNYEGVEKNSISFMTEYKNENGIELGTEKVAQEGKNGVRDIKYKYTQSVFDSIFRKDKVKKVELENKIVTEATEKIVLKGTRKWQYMMCSNGGYRYYSNDEFKNPNTGFTSKSADYCAKNNQGVKTKLADTSNGGTRASSNVSVQAPIDTSCHKENIIKFSTTYEDRSYLQQGTQQVGIPGSDGFTLFCPSIPGSQQRTNFPVTNQIVYVGTGKTSQQIANEQAEAEAARQQQLLSERRQAQMLKQVQCVLSLKAQGMSSERAQYECSRLYPIP